MSGFLVCNLHLLRSFECLLVLWGFITMEGYPCPMVNDYSHIILYIPFRQVFRAERFWIGIFSPYMLSNVTIVQKFSFQLPLFPPLPGLMGVVG